MKVYQVVMSYFDGDHEHGSYRSPQFASRELAQAFFDALVEFPDDDTRAWWTDDWSDGSAKACAVIVETEVLDSLPEIKDAEHYRSVTFT